MTEPASGSGVLRLQIARQWSVSSATPDDALAIEMSYIDKSSFRKRFAELGIRALVDVRLEKVERCGNALQATFRNELTGAESLVEASQIVVEHGTLPAAGIYHELRQFDNDGVTDIAFMLGSEEAATPAPGASSCTASATPYRAAISIR